MPKAELQSDAFETVIKMETRRWSVRENVIAAAHSFLVDLLERA
ncbi:hypothetical protein [Methylobacterium sp. J-026]|nr:hypothetical protein [Methylobacterium sp. J-026]